jgi:hypothetical protein
MRSLLAHGELSASDLTGLLSSIGAEPQSAAAYAFGNTRILLCVGRKFYFRSNDYLGILFLAATDGTTQRIDISYAGGGSGLLGFQWGAGVDLEGTLFNAVAALLNSRSIQFEDVTAPASQ